MLIQVAMNNIESIEQGEEILSKWQYHLDEDQSHVVLERDLSGTVIAISGFHPWAEELEEADGETCSCGEGEECSDHRDLGDGVEDDVEDEDDDDAVEDDEDGDESEESEVIYLGQALFVPLEDQARALAEELMEEDYIGTVSVMVGGVPLADTDAFRALPADTKNGVISALEELGDVEAYLSLYEVMGLEI
jgi:hypothetical protein